MAGFKTTEVSHPAFGGKRTLRSPSAAAQLRIAALKRRALAGEDIEHDLIVEGVASCVVDDQGKRVFKDHASALDALEQFTPEDFLPVLEALQTVMKGDEKAAADLGNSGASPSSGSPTASV